MNAKDRTNNRSYFGGMSSVGTGPPVRFFASRAIFFVAFAFASALCLAWSVACVSPFDGEDPLYDLFLARQILEGGSSQSLVSGRLTTAEGQPHANRRVFCLNSLTGSAARTDASGRFHFTVTAGTYDCDVRETGGPEFPFVLAAYQDGSSSALGANVVFHSNRPGPVPTGTVPPLRPSTPPADMGGSSPLSPPDAPFYVGGHRAILVFWNAVPGAAAYKIYWNTAGAVSEDDEFIADISANYYMHGGLRRGAVYYYRIAAVNAKGVSELSPQTRARTYRAYEYY